MIARKPAALAKAKMTLEQLRIFLAVARHLHFTRAAEMLCISQPAVSATIQTLEEEYSVKLFHRVGRRIELTEAGRLLQGEGHRILEQVAITERELREFHNLHRGELKLGATLTLGNYWLPEKIGRFKCLYPEVKVTCGLGNLEEICAGTAIGQFDLGWVTGDIRSSLHPILTQEKIAIDRLKIVVGRAHGWSKRASVAAAELTETPWILRESGAATRQQLEQFLQRQQVDLEKLNIALVLNSDEMIKAIVEEGIGATVLSEMAIGKELQLDTLRVVRITDRYQSSDIAVDMVQSILKLKHRQRYETGLAIAFEQMVSQ